MIRTRICELFGINYPILQGGMAWVSTAELAAAVSAAGALGFIAAGTQPAEAVRHQIRRARELTDRPFGVNVMLMSPYVDELMDVMVQEKVAVVATGAGNPSRYIPFLKEKGIKVVPLVASVVPAIYDHGKWSRGGIRRANKINGLVKRAPLTTIFRQKNSCKIKGLETL